MIKSIRSVLDKLAVDAMFHGQNPEGNSKPSVDQALKDIAQIIDEAIGDMEYRETEDMSLKTWSAEDLKAFGRNELRNEIKSNLREALL